MNLKSNKQFKFRINTILEIFKPISNEFQTINKHLVSVQFLNLQEKSLQHILVSKL